MQYFWQILLVTSWVLIQLLKQGLNTHADDAADNICQSLPPCDGTRGTHSSGQVDIARRVTECR
jgi:hypothetical protein